MNQLRHCEDDHLLRSVLNLRRHKLADFVGVQVSLLALLRLWSIFPTQTHRMLTPPLLLAELPHCTCRHVPLPLQR